MLEPLVLAVLWRSQGNHARASWETYSGSASLKWHSITSKADVVSFGFPKINFAWTLLQFAPLRSSSQFLCTHVGDRKQAASPPSPTPIVFSMKWHPSKLMGCNHHHKYTVTRPTARFWVFNSQSMGCKEWQAWGTQFPISLTTLSENWKRIQKTFFLFPELQNCVCLLNIFGGLQRRNIYQECTRHSVNTHWHCVSATHQHCHLVK